MKKILVEKLNGTIKNIYVPEVIEDGLPVSEDYVDNLCFEIETENGIIRTIEDRYSKCANLFVGNKVTILKNAMDCNYNEFKDLLKEHIELNYRNNSKEEKQRIFDKYCGTEEEFNNNPKKIIKFNIEV